MAGQRRQAARAVILDPGGRVLLLKARDPFDPRKGSWWELPGGGMEPGESSGSAAAREVVEETGLTSVEMGPCLWQHDAQFVFAGLRFDQLEHIHVAYFAGSESGSGSGVGEAYKPGGLEMLEAMAFGGFEWWSADALMDMVSAGALVIPPWLSAQLPVFLESGPWDEPRHMGALGQLF